MSEWLKIRVPEGDLAAWKRAAGFRGLSRWVRSCCDAEVRRRYADDGTAGRTPPPGRVLPPPEPPVESAPVCRHGLLNCRICQIGAFSRG